MLTSSYDPLANPPNYGKPDDMVLKNTNDMHENSEHWYRKAVEVVADPERVDPPLPRWNLDISRCLIFMGQMIRNKHQFFGWEIRHGIFFLGGGGGERCLASEAVLSKYA